MVNNYPRPRSFRSSRSRVTNGKSLLAGIDMRSKWGRRLHDLIANHVADLGGPSNVTQSQYILIKSAANSTIILEQWEVEFAKAGTATFPELLAYQSIVNSLRRTFETLGIGRVEPPSNGLVSYDVSKLTQAEQQRLNELNDKVEKFGLQRLNEDQLADMKTLLEKATGRGSGPSVKDAAYQNRPVHEIDYSRQGR